MDRYLKDQTFYKIQSQSIIDNPNQQIVDDLSTFTGTTLSFSLALFNAATELISFSNILYGIYPPLFVVLLVYSVGGTTISVFLGRLAFQFVLFFFGPPFHLTLDEHWKISEYKKKCIQAKTNRASDRDGFGKPLHTCGSITTSQHRANLTETNGTPPDPVDMFVYTHQHRKNKTWVDRKSEHEKYKHRWEELTQQASLEGIPPPRKIYVWTEVAGIRKRFIYELKFERDELHDTVKQLMVSLNFQPMPYTRDQVDDDDMVDDNEDVVDNNDDMSDNDESE
ncbi:ABC transporter D family member 2, chloroplastic [Trifolium repens]|nr:ABC transporter D family member 2, chloroplastic [Trifolium repens]